MFLTSPAFKFITQSLSARGFRPVKGTFSPRLGNRCTIRRSCARLLRAVRGFCLGSAFDLGARISETTGEPMISTLMAVLKQFFRPGNSSNYRPFANEKSRLRSRRSVPGSSRSGSNPRMTSPISVARPDSTLTVPLLESGQ